MYLPKTIAAATAAAMLLSLGPALAAKNSSKPAASKATKAVAAAAVAGPVIVTVQPPSGQWEGKPPPAEGWVWSAGYHAWKDGRFVWTPGEWILDKPGMDYRQRQWVEAGEGKWKLVGGDWVAEKHAAK